MRPPRTFANFAFGTCIVYVWNVPAILAETYRTWENRHFIVDVHNSRNEIGLADGQDRTISLYTDGHCQNIIPVVLEGWRRICLHSNISDWLSKSVSGCILIYMYTYISDIFGLIITFMAVVLAVYGARLGHTGCNVCFFLRALINIVSRYICVRTQTQTLLHN